MTEPANPNQLYAVVVVMADQGQPIILRKRSRHDVLTLKFTLEASVKGDWSTPQRQTLGQPFWAIDDQLIVAAHISRMQVFPDEAFDLPPDQRPAKLGFELFQ